jgi:rod shape-determining protein MreC
MVLVLGALTLMAVDHRNARALMPLRTAANMLVYPLLVAVDFPQRVYKASIDFVSDQVALSVENAALRQQGQLYAAQQQHMDTIQQENKRLRSMLEAVPQATYTFSMAEVLKAADDRVSGIVTLNKGTRDGVQESQVVLAGNNIYGQVTAVTPVSATVMQLVDPGHSIPVRNQRTGERGLANGEGRGAPLEIKNLPSSSTVKEGDIFVSSGLGGVFPPDFPVAQVIPQGVEFNPGDPFATVKAKPLANYEAIREVLLVWAKPGTAASVKQEKPVDAK